jgi:hypothetical protein
MLRTFGSAAAINFLLISAAHAESQYAQAGMVEWPLVVVIVLGVGSLLLTAIPDSMGPPAPRETNAELAKRYEEEAFIAHSLKRKLDAEKELTATMIEKARVDAVYSELKEITDHDRTVRGANRRS